MQNVLAKYEMFEETGSGETSKQGQEVDSVSCQANNVGQFRQAFKESLCLALLDILKKNNQCSRTWGGLSSVCTKVKPVTKY